MGPCVLGDSPLWKSSLGNERPETKGAESGIRGETTVESDGDPGPAALSFPRWKGFVCPRELQTTASVPCFHSTYICTLAQKTNFLLGVISLRDVEKQELSAQMINGGDFLPVRSFRCRGFHQRGVESIFWVCPCLHLSRSRETWSLERVG